MIDHELTAQVTEMLNRAHNYNKAVLSSNARGYPGIDESRNSRNRT